MQIEQLQEFPGYLTLIKQRIRSNKRDPFDDSNCA